MCVSARRSSPLSCVAPPGRPLLYCLRAMQYGLDPASLDADVEAAQRLNFDFRRYADVLPRLRQLATHSELQARGPC